MNAKYSEEFKTQVVREVIDNSRTVAGVAREYGLNAETVRLWVKKHREQHGDSLPALGASEREELQRLRKEVRELKMEQEFLKKAAAFFAKEYR